MNEEVMEAAHIDDAESLAYLSWKDDVESQAEYSAEPLTKDLAEEHGIDWEEE
jgi:hypothetical protein